jgi:hypothetical protein
MCQNLRHLSLIAAALLACGGALKADTFAFQFLGGPTAGSAVVGTGTFSFTGTVSDGTYHLNTLPNYSFNFTIDSATWTNANLATPISGIEAVFYNNDTAMYFSNDGTFGGPFGGSADFVNGGTGLSFEPPGFGPPPLNLYQAVDSQGKDYFGEFTTANVPEPSSAATLLLSGAIAAAFAIRRKRQRA